MVNEDIKDLTEIVEEEKIGSCGKEQVKDLAIGIGEKIRGKGRGRFGSPIDRASYLGMNRLIPSFLQFALPITTFATSPIGSKQHNFGFKSNFSSTQSHQSWLISGDYSTKSAEL